MATGIPRYENLPGVKVLKNDGGLQPESTAPAPRVLVIGTAGKGRGSSPFLVRTTQLARGEFGTEGTLARGMFEAKKAGAAEIALFRMGATSASVTGIGGEATGGTGYTISTIMQDDAAGETYSVYYDDTTDRLIVWSVTTELIVYDNDPTAFIDRGEVIVSGYRDQSEAAPYWDNIGTPSAGVTIEDIALLTPTNSDYIVIDGTDGTSLSRMEIYEALYKAYKLLADYRFDVCVPMDVYLDDYNTVDQGIGAVPPVSDNGANSYPDSGDYKPGLSIDSLGMVFVEEYEGEYYFFWRFATSGATADIYPAGIGSANATTKIDGTALEATDFHEVNFAYQLARFLFEFSTNTVDATGSIGVRPPASASLADLAGWIGKEPTYTVDASTGEYYIASALDNGNGLLGNKFMAGQFTYRAGAYGGGFIATSEEFMDAGDIAYDDNEYPIDLGKYISIVTDWPIIRSDLIPGGAGYVASYAPSYAGFYSTLPPNSAPTNKVVPNARLYYKLGVRRLNSLTGRGYVSLRDKPTGVAVTDAPTASLPGSDYKRLSTCRIVKDVIDNVRTVLDPFIGEGTTDAGKAAMHTAVEGVLVKAKKAKYLNAYREFDIYQTPDMRVQGKAEISLTLVPAFELREITVTISLAKE